MFKFLAILFGLDGEDVQPRIYGTAGSRLDEVDDRKLVILLKMIDRVQEVLGELLAAPGNVDCDEPGDDSTSRSGQ